MICLFPFRGGRPFFWRYSLVFISDIESLFTPFPSFFFTVSVIFLIIGFIILNNNGVAAAPAVAKTAIATDVVDWFTDGRNYSTAVVSSYKVTQVFPSSLSSWPITLSSPDCVISPTLNCPGPGQATSSSFVSGIASGVNSGGVGGGSTGGGGVYLVIISCSGW